MQTLNGNIKVCHITSAHPRYDVRILKKECTSLARKYKTYLILNDENPDEIIDGVDILSTGFAPKNRMERMFKSTNMIYIKVLKLKPNILHFHDPELLGIALKIKRKLKIKVIFDSHENTIQQIDSKTYIPINMRKFVKLCYKLYQNYVCKRLDGIITVDPEIEKSFAKVNSNTTVITNYPILEAVPLADEVINDEMHYIGFAGGITNQWNHDTIIQSLKPLANCRYKLCGKSDGSYLDSLMKMKCWDQVDYYGQISHDKVIRLLHSCTVGVALCSYSGNCNGTKGTLGNTKIFEIMMAGIPIICTDFEIWKEIIEEGQCGICIKPDQVEELVKALKIIFADKNKAQLMGENGRKLICEKYNWSIMENKLLNFYSKILLDG